MANTAMVAPNTLLTPVKDLYRRVCHTVWYHTWLAIQFGTTVWLKQVWVPAVA